MVKIADIRVSLNGLKNAIFIIYINFVVLVIRALFIVTKVFLLHHESSYFSDWRMVRHDTMMDIASLGHGLIVH